MARFRESRHWEGLGTVGKPLERIGKDWEGLGYWRLPWTRQQINHRDENYSAAKTREQNNPQHFATPFNRTVIYDEYTIIFSTMPTFVYIYVKSERFRTVVEIRIWCISESLWEDSESVNNGFRMFGQLVPRLKTDCETVGNPSSFGTLYERFDII